MKIKIIALSFILSAFYMSCSSSGTGTAAELENCMANSDIKFTSAAISLKREGIDFNKVLCNDEGNSWWHQCLYFCWGGYEFF